MRDLQTSGIVGLSASKMGCKHSDRHGEVNDKKMLPFCQQFLPACGQRRVLLVDTHTRGNKVVFVSPSIITGVLKSASASLVMPAINFSCLCPY